MVNSHGNDWDVKLPLIPLSIRTTRHQSIRMAPSMALLGRNLTLPGFAALNLELPDPEAGNSAVNEATTASRSELLARVQEGALRNIVHAEALQAASYARAHARKRGITADEDITPEVGDYVLIRKLQGGKLTAAWEPGVYKVIAWDDKKTWATLMGTQGSTPWTKNAKNIKLYRSAGTT